MCITLAHDHSGYSSWMIYACCMWYVSLRVCLCSYIQYWRCTIQVDVELARQIAGSELRDVERQRKLWLKVAQHVIKKEKNMEK